MLVADQGHGEEKEDQGLGEELGEGEIGSTEPQEKEGNEQTDKAQRDQEREGFPGSGCDDCGNSQKRSQTKEDEGIPAPSERKRGPFVKVQREKGKESNRGQENRKVRSQAPFFEDDTDPIGKATEAPEGEIKKPPPRGAGKSGEERRAGVS